MSAVARAKTSIGFEDTLLDPENYLNDQEKKDIADSTTVEAFLRRWELRLRGTDLRNFRLGISRKAFARAHSRDLAVITGRELRSVWLMYFNVESVEDIDDAHGEIKEDVLAIRIHDETDEEDLNAIESHFGLPARVRDRIPMLLDAFEDLIVLSVDDDMNDVALFGKLDGRDTWTIIDRWGSAAEEVPGMAETVQAIMDLRERARKGVLGRAIGRAIVAGILSWLLVRLFFALSGYSALVEIWPRAEVDWWINGLGAAPDLPFLVAISVVFSFLRSLIALSNQRRKVNEEIKEKYEAFRWYIG